ncbi:MAG: hypothetical protein ACUVQ4_08435 [bacterium]
MKKRILLSVILFIASIKGEDLYYYAGGTKIDLFSYKDRISVTWQKHMTAEDGENILQSEPTIKSWNPAIGIRTGVNYDILYYPSENRRLSGLGYSIGLEFECDFWKIVGCNLGCSFVQNQYTYRIHSAWGEESTYIFNSLYLPVGIDFILKKFSWAQLSLNIGAAGVFQLSGRITGWVEPQPIDTEITNLSNKLYFRCGIGLPIKFTSRLKLNPCFHYQYNLASDNRDYFSRPHQFYDFLFTIAILYIFQNSSH